METDIWENGRMTSEKEREFTTTIMVMSMKACGGTIKRMELDC